MYESLIDKRNDLSITEDEMADYLGISKVIYNLKEKGELDFNLVEVRKILNILNDTYENIFFNNNVTENSYKKVCVE